MGKQAVKKKKVVLITYTFPYGKTFETFLETEIKYWEVQEAFELVVLPMYTDVYQRKISDNITVDDSFAEFLSSKKQKISQKKYKFLSIFKSIYKPLFWKELFAVPDKTPSILKAFLYSMRKYEMYKDFLKKYTQDNDIDIFYTYWNTEVTYALQSLSSRSKYEVITRIHGHDLYKERNSRNYIPLKKQFTKNIKQIFTITDQAIAYMEKTYGFQKETIQTSRLGIEDQEIVTEASTDYRFHIVSCSHTVPLKRIDKIIDALVLLVDKQKEIMINWTHIGSGILLDELKQYAYKKLNSSNVQYAFLGPLSNQAVYEFYANRQVDVFVNVSDDEGVPVSIMEAMSCHIPIVAPDIGGISDMVVSDYNGILMSSDPAPEEIAEVLESFAYFKDETIRQNSYRQYRKYYDAEVNYSSFIKALEAL